MRKIYFLLALSMVLMLSGCSAKSNVVTVSLQSSNGKNTPTSNSETYIVRHPPVAGKPIGDINVIISKRLNYLEDALKFDDYLDLRDSDLSNVNLSQNSAELNNSSFSTHTKWPKKMPESFKPDTILELGKNQGLGIRKLNNEGIDGRGINIAIVDQPLLVDHEQYKDQIKFYDESDCEGEASMHGPAMTSIAVGKTIGVAPKAKLYYVGCYNFNTKENNSKIDFIGVAKAVDRILEINKTLIEKDKIRVLSISVGWCPNNKGYKEMNQAVERAKEAGIFVISANIFETYNNKFWYYGVDREPMADPEKQSSYKPHKWSNWISFIAAIPGFAKYYEEKYNKLEAKEILLVPMCSKTYASFEGVKDYSFNRIGGWSSVEPYLAGLYALSCQVKPNITPELFWSTALKTGDTMEIRNEGKETKTGKLINPIKLIEALKNDK
ncbi:S8 family serine peptidase [Clostridium estertheticum]|uniref:S8 family serine peptidase n=1 Tax=Clostridium estertheticum TaxID=238834 RepID=UPI0013E98739|nr:S8 family serine peptidase [Clostridium estertheticum]MBZ9686915.1 S8 family serine peptidase [Clostridium estertheticum]